MGYEVCYPGTVKGWAPRTNYWTFVVKPDAGNEFTAVNNCVRNCCQDIDGIITALRTLKEKMGENTGTSTQIDYIVKIFEEKKQDLINKNSEMIQACEQVLDFVQVNKASKASEAVTILNTVREIDLYKG